MIASGFVPRTIVGRMRCDSAESNAPFSSDSSESIEQEAGHRVDEVPDGDASRHGRPAELHREEQDQEQTPPEDRHRIAGERHAHDAVVEHRVAAHRGEHAGGNADDEREQDGADGELDRRREQRGELAQHGLLRDHRLAEVALQHAADVDAVLDEHRPVEPVLLEQRRVARGVDAALARHGLDRIARHDPDEEEREQRHAEKGRDDEADAGEQKAQHRVGVAGPRPRGAALPGGLAVQEV